MSDALIFSDLGDGAHRALFEAFAARDAGILVHDFGHAARNLKHFLRACIYADAATNALVSVDNGMSHDDPFLVLAVLNPLHSL